MKHKLTWFFANSANQNTKSQGCTSSTPLSGSQDTSLAQRRTSLHRASARTLSPHSSTFTAALQMTRSDHFMSIYLLVFKTDCTWFVPWTAFKTSPSNAVGCHWKCLWIGSPLFDVKSSSSLCWCDISERPYMMDRPVTAWCLTAADKILASCFFLPLTGCMCFVHSLLCRPLQPKQMVLIENKY